jgi:putative transcriptional regulator
MSNGRKIINGLEEAVAHAKGLGGATKIRVVHVPNTIDVRSIREKLGLSQEEFCLRFGFSLGTVRHWEQGRRYPDGAARVLLTVINRAPKAVCEALEEEARAANAGRAA